MKQYVDLVVKILAEGKEKSDRTGTGTISIFGHQSEYKMSDGFPLLTLKNTHTRSIIHELLWFLRGDTNTQYLKDNKVSIWDEWSDKNGDLGPVYGKQWVDWNTNTQFISRRSSGKVENGKIVEENFIEDIPMGFKTINQIQNIIDTLNEKPHDRGMIVSAWNVGELGNMALRPCHCLFQFYSTELSLQERRLIAKDTPEFAQKYFENYKQIFSNPDILGYDNISEEELDNMGIPKRDLSLQLYQKSADTGLGVPFNIASYALLLHMVAQVVGMHPQKFVHTFGDAHLYLDHKDGINTLLNRTHSDKNGMYRGHTFDFWEHRDHKDFKKYIGSHTGPSLPTLKLNPDVKDIFDFKFEDIEIVDYNPMKTIKMPISI